MKITPYKIRRDHGNRTGFYLVAVPEGVSYRRGVGFQFSFRGVVYGVSLVWL